ncbi:MAG: hypothetical protein IJ756_00200 [Paludibacteraceae bacterium]|nr:hypothetical protein [Paludibacteraceae bacterium]
MESKESTNKILQVMYYLIYITMIVVTIVFYYLFHKNDASEFPDLQSQFSLILQYIVIGFTLLGVPGGLYLHKYYCGKLKKITDEKEKLRRYFKVCGARMILVSLGLFFGVYAFFALGAYKPMIYCAAISAIALVFCKPTMAKLEIDLDPNSL